MLELHHGQGMEIWWRDNFVSPSEDEYRQMVMRKCGGLFNLGVRLMQLFTSRELRHRWNFDRLCELLSLLFQIRDDYCNLMSKDYANKKSFCEDLTEGKFSFPILHAVNTRENDTRIIHILKQRTEDVELKRYCVRLLHEFGSIDYTRKVCQDLAKQIYDEIGKLGGNPYLENLIQSLMDVFPNKTETNNQERYVTDQIDEDESQQYRDYSKISTNTNGRYHT